MVNHELLHRLLPQLNYSALLQAVEQLAPYVPGGLPSLPSSPPPCWSTINTTTTETPAVDHHKSDDDDDDDTKPVAATIKDDDEDDDQTSEEKDNKNRRLEGNTPPSDDDGDVTQQRPQQQEWEANLHKVLFDVHLIHGTLVCPGTQRRFPVKDAIPNMLLHADEI